MNAFPDLFTANFNTLIHKHYPWLIFLKGILLQGLISEAVSFFHLLPFVRSHYIFWIFSFWIMKSCFVVTGAPPPLPSRKDGPPQQSSYVNMAPKGKSNFLPSTKWLVNIIFLLLAYQVSNFVSRLFRHIFFCAVIM